MYPAWGQINPIILRGVLQKLTFGSSFELNGFKKQEEI
jgi:hypothetical protein